MTGVVKHRHAVESGYARGEETRERIVNAALQMFGQRGFEAASTRDIATLAGVNAPALQYYFDSKEGLFVACVERIVKRVWEYMSAVVAGAERLIAERAAVEDLIEAFCDIQAQLAQFMFTTSDKDDWRLFMARIQAGEGPSAGFELAYKNISCRLSGVTCAIVGRLLGRPADDEETLVRTVTLSGQLVVFQMSRRSVMTKLKWDKIDADRLGLLLRVNREHTRLVLRSMVAGRLASHAPGTARRPRVVTQKKKVGRR
jgi:TetR/AcrR family transcriptional regulator, regulator of cefoperazone and chloramphenicol sensitivity